MVNTLEYYGRGEGVWSRLGERGCGQTIGGSGCGQTIFYLCLAGSRDWQWEDGGMCPAALVCFQASFHTFPILLPHPPPPSSSPILLPHPPPPSSSPILLSTHAHIHRLSVCQSFRLSMKHSETGKQERLEG